MTRPTRWERIVALPDKTFLEDPDVKKILDKLPTRDDIRENAEDIIKNGASGPGTTSAEARLWNAHETLWELWGSKEFRNLRKPIRAKDIILYKKLTKYFCKIANEYSNEVKNNDKVDLDNYKVMRKDNKLAEIRVNNPDMKDKILHKKNLKMSKHKDTHMDQDDIIMVRVLEV
jgi:hypothetical protein